MIDSEKDGVGYRVAVSKEKITQQDMTGLFMPFSEKEVFSITPVIAGAGRGFGQILAGIALVVAIAVPAAAFATQKSCLAWNCIFGGSLILQGIANAISPQPGVPEFDESPQLESFSFSNVVNTSRQGLPVPIAYGRVFVGLFPAALTLMR